MLGLGCPKQAFAKIAIPPLKIITSLSSVSLILNVGGDGLSPAGQFYSLAA
ncbi:hypothetical protein [Bathymodiolus platifrons methanotrophic gill symbiont]|uniref:hypothetical protein n=1 Tax=Bathymodiolus platifrons methanotrophic gill symbiont TaxID=113268 RepID=UPI001C8E7E8F|nr:hypothetical protein [Bathymodiolus platifrons methanotrophic gill symbiont]